MPARYRGIAIEMVLTKDLQTGWVTGIQYCFTLPGQKLAALTMYDAVQQIDAVLGKCLMLPDSAPQHPA